MGINLNVLGAVVAVAFFVSAILVFLAAKLIQGATNSRARLSQSLLLFSPETVLR